MTSPQAGPPPDLSGWLAEARRLMQKSPDINLPPTPPAADIDMELLSEPQTDELTPCPPHVPIRDNRGTFAYARPGPNWIPPRGNDPYYWYNNLDLDQMKHWLTLPGHSVLIRLAYEGCPTPEQEEPRIQLIESIITGALGNVAGLRITPPAPSEAPENKSGKAGTQPKIRPRQPPYSYLASGLSEEMKVRLEEMKAISTAIGTIFITPNRPIFGSLLFSLSGLLRSTTPQEMATHLIAAFDDIGLNARLRTMIAANPNFADTDTEQAVQQIRRSLHVTLHVEPLPTGLFRRVGHVYLTSPTEVAKLWQDFRDELIKARLRAPVIGMSIKHFKDWLCDCCHSSMHPTAQCPQESEPGWYAIPNRPAPTQTAAPEQS
ncbi:hypothetical protein BDW22DRAFT_1433642 [Trametopsis cervina]|nr:hypothetical protein BDW22DRAFT_1433642 [Trametopsis cervina]